mgnify:CR=1 FL=1
MLTTEQKLLSAASHLGIFVGLPIVIPLIIFLVTKDEFIKRQSMEALGFQIFLAISSAIAGILAILLVGIPLLIIIGIIALIFPIIATVKVLDSIDYSYPISGKYVRKTL